MKKDAYIAKYCTGQGVEIGGADNCVEGIDTLKIDNKLDFFGKHYPVDCVADATSLRVFRDSQFDFVISIHVLEHLTNPLKALVEWHRVVRDGGYIVTAIPKKDCTFDRYRDRTPLCHLLDDFRDDVGPLDDTHIEEWCQFSAPAVMLENHTGHVPNELLCQRMARYYRGEHHLERRADVRTLRSVLEDDKARHAQQVRDGVPPDFHQHVWADTHDVEAMLRAAGFRLVELVDDYLSNGFLFVIQVAKNPDQVAQRAAQLRQGRYPDWVDRTTTSSPGPYAGRSTARIMAAEVLRKPLIGPAVHGCRRLAGGIRRRALNMIRPGG